MAETTLNNDNFDSEVLKSEKPVLVDFWASWCGPCMMMGPVVEELANDLDGQIKVGKLNVDDNPELVQKYGIMSIPCFILFKNGEPAATSVGGRSKDDLRSFALQ